MNEELLEYTSPEGKYVNPVDYLHRSWASDSLGAVWYGLLGHFIFDNSAGFFPDLVSDEACITVVRPEGSDMIMRSSYIKDILAADIFNNEFWSNPEHPGFLMDEVLHSALREVLTTGRLIRDTLRIRATPILRHGAERIELKLVWLEATDLTLEAKT